MANTTRLMYRLLTWGGGQKSVVWLSLPTVFLNMIRVYIDTWYTWWLVVSYSIYFEKWICHLPNLLFCVYFCSRVAWLKVLERVMYQLNKLIKCYTSLSSHLLLKVILKIYKLICNYSWLFKFNQVNARVIIKLWHLL